MRKKCKYISYLNRSFLIKSYRSEYVINYKRKIMFIFHKYAQKTMITIQHGATLQFKFNDFFQKVLNEQHLSEINVSVYELCNNLCMV